MLAVVLFCLLFYWTSPPESTREEKLDLCQENVERVVKKIATNQNMDTSTKGGIKLIFNGQKIIAVW